jgi:hypothetical protein
VGSPESLTRPGRGALDDVPLDGEIARHADLGSDVHGGEDGIHEATLTRPDVERVSVRPNAR